MAASHSDCMIAVKHLEEDVYNCFKCFALGPLQYYTTSAVRAIKRNWPKIIAECYGGKQQ